MKQYFKYPSKWQSISFLLMIIGAVLFAIGCFTIDSHSRIFTALLYNSYFFLMIGVLGLFFAVVHEIGFGGWLIAIKRVLEAMGMFIPIGAVLLLIVLFFGMDDIYYHWMHAPASDKLIEGKKAFLNVPGFLFRSIIVLVGWSALALWFRSNSRLVDKFGGRKNYDKSIVISSIFLVFFAITSSTSSWDWLMSIDPHWYSTLYGWYCFASLFVSSLCVMVILINILKRAGYLENVTEEHMHDLGKFIFGISIFWTYLWFSTFMLQWYSNISEETLYYDARIEGGYKFLFFFVLINNFVFPFFALMRAGKKRNWNHLLIVAIVVLFGHWLDFYMLTMPGAVGAENSGIFIELAIACFYVGLFGLVFFKSLTKAKLTQTNHPFIQESLQHHT